MRWTASRPFSGAPLKIATWLGFLIAMGAFAYALVIIVKTLVHGISVPGYASLMVVVLFLGGIQLVAVGLLGEYLGRVFEESKRRPLYFVRDSINVDEKPPVEADPGAVGQRVAP